MPSSPFRTAFISAALLGSFGAGPAMAERALIIANHQYADAAPQPDLRGDAANVSRSFLGLGYATNRIENPTAETLTAALDLLSETDGPIVIYYGGRTVVEEGQTNLLLTDGSQLALTDMLARADNPSDTIVFLDICRAAAVQSAEAAEVEGVEDTAATIASFAGFGDVPQVVDTFLAATAAPATACPDEPLALADALLDRLQLTGVPLDTLFADTAITTTSTLTAPFFFREVATGAQLTAEDYDYLDTLSPAAQEQIIAAWTASGIAVDRAVTGNAAPQTNTPTRPSGTVVLSSPIKPVSGGATLAPITRQVARISAGASAPVTTPAPAQVETSGNSSRPVPGTGNLPQPSIIVGLLEPTLASFNTAAAPTGPVSGSTLEYSDVEGRRALRDGDPETFATLVSGGAFDPPEEELVVALQTELQRMNCYTAGIDGQWGPGSRRALASYYAEIDGAAPSQDPTFEIFRAIMLRDDVTCPAPVAAPARPAAQPQRSTPQRQPAAQQPAPAPQPAAPAQPSRTINRNTGTGIFR